VPKKKPEPKKPPPRFPKHEKAISRARADERAGVDEDPDGSNSGRRVREMQGHTWLGGTGWPWCVAACVCWAEEAGFVLPYQGAGAYAYLDWARRSGWAVPAAQAQPGDFVVFNIGSGHMAMLEYKVTGGTVRTVGGNESDRVKRSERSTSLVRGYVHLPEAHTVPKAKPPLFEVVTSESGHKKIYVSNARKVARKLPQILEKHPRGVTIRRRKKKPAS